jgi:hypothetical protein
MGERIEFKSPRGEALYPSLNKTEIFKGKDTGRYVMRLVLAGDALETVKAQVEEFLTNVYGARKARYAKRPFKTTKDGDKTFITFRAKAVIDGRPRHLDVYDSNGDLVKRELNIGSGSIVRVSGSMSSWIEEPGVSFYMDAVQVINLIEPPEGPFEADGSDGGFVS